jgi:O-acetyl-ADP-ribose deacetylase (regulator of RNase III)
LPPKPNFKELKSYQNAKQKKLQTSSKSNERLFIRQSSIFEIGTKFQTPYLGITLEAKLGNICEQSVDGILCPLREINYNLKNLETIITKAGGKEIELEATIFLSRWQQNETEPPDQPEESTRVVKVEPDESQGLAAAIKFIIFVPTPEVFSSIFSPGGKSFETFAKQMCRDAYLNGLVAAQNSGCNSVAFPGIGTKISNENSDAIPKKWAASALIGAVIDYETARRLDAENFDARRLDAENHISKILLVDIDEEMVDCFYQELSASYESDIKL